MDADDLDQLLLDARVANELADVTGALLYGGQRFFQYLEGTRADVEQIYARIARASQHHRLEILEQGRVDKRVFQRWHMGSPMPHRPWCSSSARRNGAVKFRGWRTSPPPRPV